MFEVKDYSGWIFGNEHQRHWTQLLAYGKEKHRFYNPVIQNSGHIQAIRQCLPQIGIPIYSVIVFFGNSEFKNVTCNANNTFIIYPRSIRQVVAEILMQPNANYGNKYEIMDVFAKAVQNGNDDDCFFTNQFCCILWSQHASIYIYYISQFIIPLWQVLAQKKISVVHSSSEFLHLYSVILFSQSSNYIYPLPHRPPH